MSDKTFVVLIALILTAGGIWIFLDRLKFGFLYALSVAAHGVLITAILLSITLVILRAIQEAIK